MQFILKDGFIHIVNNQGLAGSKIKADVVIKYVEDFENRKFSYSINGGVYKPLKNEILAIDKDDIKGNQIEIKVKAAKKDSVLLYISDPVPVTYAVMFGEPMEDAYPARFAQIEARLDRTHKLVEKTINFMEGFLKEQEKRGRLL